MSASSSSSIFPAITEQTGGRLSGNEPLSDKYSFAQPEVASNVYMEPSMFMAGSWEPSLPSLYPDRQIMAQDSSYVTGSYGYCLAPYQQPGTASLEHVYPTQDSFLNLNVETYKSPLLDDNLDQSQIPTLHRESQTLSRIQTSFGSRCSRRIQSGELVTHPVSVNYLKGSANSVHLSPAVTRPKRSLVQSFKNSSVEDVGYHDKPYAYLLYEALRSANHHRMSLQEIYKWFEENTNKAHDAQSKGWQSSIRHNLSMNEVSFSLNSDSGPSEY